MATLKGVGISILGGVERHAKADYGKPQLSSMPWSASTWFLPVLQFGEDIRKGEKRR